MTRTVPLLGDWYMTIDELSAYSHISRRQLERYVSRAAASAPLPSVRNGRRRLVLKSVFDEWIAAESRGANDRSEPGARRAARSSDEIIAGVKARYANRQEAPRGT